MLFKKNKICRYCGSSQLTKFLSLGDQPPSNSFIDAKQVNNEKRYPLDVYFCEQCFLTQLLDVVPAETIFDDYMYLSSSSKALKKHYAQLAEFLVHRFGLGAGDLVVDIGCNDGILLNGYPGNDLLKVGVEPSKVGKIAEESGLKIVNEFFVSKSAQHIIEMYGKAKIVTATNVFAHVDKIGEFVEGVTSLLDNNGVFVVEAPYLIDLVEKTLFDTIYHEHLCYLSLTPIISFFSQYGLEIFDVERVPFGASGPALRIFSRKKIGNQPVEDSVAQILSYEDKWGVGCIDRYIGYAEKVEKIKTQTLEIIENLKADGNSIGGYGAPAKGNTLLNYYGITSSDLGCIAETNKLKQGLLTPGTHIPIISEEEFLEMMPPYALLLTWNYLDFFLKNSEYISKGGKFIVPIPVPRITP